MISSRREDRSSGAAPAEAPARPLLRDQLRPHLTRNTSSSSASTATARAGYGECVAEQRSRTTARKPTRPSWHIITDFIAPRVLGADVRAPARRLSRAQGDPRPQHGEGRRRNGGVGSVRAGSAASRCARVLGGSARSHRVRRVDRHPGFARRARCRRSSASCAAGYQRIKIKIKPGWDVAAGRGGARALRRHPADGGRERRLHARRTPIISAQLDAFDLMMIEQPLDYDDVADHAALQRRLTTPICLDESIKTGRHRRARRSPPAPAGSSTSSRAASAASRSRSGCTICAPRTAFRCGTAGCSSRASAARRTSICRRCRIFRCPATSPPASATSIPISSSRRSRSPPTARFRSRSAPGLGVTIRAGPRRRARHCRSAMLQGRRRWRSDRPEGESRKAERQWPSPDGASSRSRCLLAFATSRVRQAPPAPPVVKPVPFEQKMASILRLEDQRVLRDPPRPSRRRRAAAAAVARRKRAAGRRRRRRLAARSRSVCSSDEEARVRRRAPRSRSDASGSPKACRRCVGVSPTPIRKCGRWRRSRLGLIGDARARAIRSCTALADASPLVQGSAAEALGPDRRSRRGRRGRPHGAQIVAVGRARADADRRGRREAATRRRRRLVSASRRWFGSRRIAQLAAAVLDPAAVSRACAGGRSPYALQRLEDRRARCRRC